MAATLIASEKSVKKMTVNPPKLPRPCAETRAALINMLAPTLGSRHAARLVQRAIKEEKTIRQVIAEERLLSTEQLDTILDLSALTAGRR